MNDNNCFPEIDIKNIPRPVLKRSHARCYTDQEIQNYENAGNSNNTNSMIQIINKAKYNLVTYCDDNPVQYDNNFPTLLPIMYNEDYINDFINNKTPSPRKINEKNTQTEASTLTKPTLNRHQTR
jgi:hypothetical protein